MENYLRKPGEKGNLYDGRIFSDEELKLLSNETRRLYDSFFNRDYSITELREYDYENIVKIIDEVIKGLKIQGVDITGYYAREKMNAFGVKILNDIISKRNSIVQRKKWDKIEEDMQLEKLNSSVEFLVNNNKGYNFGLREIGRIEYVNKVIKEQARKIKETIDRDMVAMPTYVAQYQEIQSKYAHEKAKWESKSRLGQFFARLTGKDKEYNDARRQAVSYNSIRLDSYGSTIKHKGDYVPATSIEDNSNNEYLFIAPSMPIHYEAVETTGRSR